jgi:hypothetical protein
MHVIGVASSTWKGSFLTILADFKIVTAAVNEQLGLIGSDGLWSVYAAAD